MSRRNCDPKGSVKWYIPKRKRPIAYSTRAANDLIVVLSKEYTTIQDVYDHVTYDIEARKVFKAYIDKGFRDVVARDWFK